MTWRRALLTAVGAGTFSVCALIVLRVQTEFAWGWALLVAALVLLLSLNLPDDPRVDAPRTPAQPDYVGSDVSRLAWAINLHTDTVNEAVTRRLRATLRRRLLRLGIDVDDPARMPEVDRLLGRGLWNRLSGGRTRVADIRQGLDVADRLLQGRPDRPPDDTYFSTQRESTS